MPALLASPYHATSQNPQDYTAMERLIQASDTDWTIVVRRGCWVVAPRNAAGRR
jgi:hypothetical protein